MKRLFMTTVVAFLAAAAWCAPADSPPGRHLSMPSVGARAPGFALLGSDGRAHGLDAHRGREAVVLAFYPKAFTGG